MFIDIRYFATGSLPTRCSTRSVQSLPFFFVKAVDCRSLSSAIPIRSDSFAASNLCSIPRTNLPVESSCICTAVANLFWYFNFIDHDTVKSVV